MVFGEPYWIRSNGTFLKRKAIIQQYYCLFIQKKSYYTLAILIPSLYLSARIGYYFIRGGGDREAKPPLFVYSDYTPITLHGKIYKLNLKCYNLIKS